jgi:thiol-disulfide isomerase/thioredoxin
VVTPGLDVLLVAVAGAFGFGLWRLFTDGRFRGTHKVQGAPVTDEHDDRVNVWDLIDGDVPLGESATLLQFSSAFCVPCRATRRILTDVAAVVPGVRHLDIDAEHHLELVRELGIMRTPTTLVLDRRGREVRRAVGAPRKEDVFAALNEAVS